MAECSIANLKGGQSHSQFGEIPLNRVYLVVRGLVTL